MEHNERTRELLREAAEKLREADGRITVTVDKCGECGVNKYSDWEGARAKETIGAAITKTERAIGLLEDGKEGGGRGHK